MTASLFDRLGEKAARYLASHASRRGVLGKVGTALAIAPAFPLLPVSRAEAEEKPVSASLTDFERKAQTKDPDKCDYWRHCAIDGVLCGCCGGGVHTCPPGTEPSPVSWIGTCRNPADGLSYVIAYRDCCGRATCNAPADCDCNTADREMPIYKPQTSNDIIWCFGTKSTTYHCSTSAIIGKAS
ncbi:MAG: methylamine dehydrogenase (amicyanin) small subunit [Acetobacter sp.]|jgi:methylamine dehydrogenase light chain|nr:methylamine dehydrogenase (amicyanin) small subunit [Acetobacter sp.]MCH4062100.1 methylamine dehydrogenase (amicyanin) small subunit [Acetobacter sp.]MCH4089053.1 methylamine dehydrogenase (amicyanin) small subunit [Acetobacter sp.]MCI1293223.1 methylamine dehydrogenase (amicyanin) small subunit [Acetobacter sp.]MCI1320154.1 methylamine dehydrogenase (amicyanin) small subunit [Acetobacter sp.]